MMRVSRPRTDVDILGVRCSEPEELCCSAAHEKTRGALRQANAAGAPAAGSGPSAVRALTAAPREAGDPEALRRVEDRLTGIEEQLGAIRSIEAAMSRSLLRLSQ